MLFFALLVLTLAESAGLFITNAFSRAAPISSEVQKLSAFSDSGWPVAVIIGLQSEHPGASSVISIGHFASALAGSLAAAAFFTIIGAKAPADGERTLDVGRINIREPDGTLRMVLSSAALEPGIIVKGREQPHPSRRSAGILFYNNEGTENGGLIFDGQREADGHRQSGGSLAFDRYEQDQMVQVKATEDGPDRVAGLTVNDQPEPTFDFGGIERARHLPQSKQAEAYRAAHVGGAHRLFVGREVDGSSELTLKDATGADRLVLKVTAAGAASITFLDRAGHVVDQLEPGAAGRIGN